MRIELYCPHCSCRFVAPPDASAEEINERMFDEGPWYALGDGNTFEDMISTPLTERGAICCPECGDPVSVSEESLGQRAMEMLSGFCPGPRRCILARRKTQSVRSLGNLDCP